MFVCFFDLETTNRVPAKAEIIQIAAIVFEILNNDCREIQTFERKLQFDIDKADPEALEKNCYDEATWKREAIPQSTALIEFDKFVKPYKDVKRISNRTGRPFYCLATGGHNIISYDLPILRKWYDKHNGFCPCDFQMCFDSLELAKSKIYIEHDFPEKPVDLKLETLCEYFKIPLLDAHDATADIRGTARLYWRLVNLEKNKKESPQQ